jgi:hypothetical protein
LAHGLSWYETLALASFGWWPVVLPGLLLLARWGWRRQARHWTGWLVMVPALVAALVVGLAAFDLRE